jgi:hypothetical protein
LSPATPTIVSSSCISISRPSDVALDLDRHARDQLGALQHGEDVVQRDAALELQRREAGGDLVQPRAVLVQRREGLVGLGQHHRDVLEDVLAAVHVQRHDLAPLGDGDDQRVGLLGHALGRAVARAGLRAEDRRVRHQLRVRPGDLRPELVEDDRAVHLGQLVEHRRRVVHVQLDAAGEQEGELVGVADDEQAARPRIHDVVDALPDRRARRDHLERLHQPGLLPRFELSELFP